MLIIHPSLCGWAAGNTFSDCFRPCMGGVVDYFLKNMPYLPVLRMGTVVCCTLP